MGTVQQRSKSTSPTKKQETLEWKRRLMHNQIGYGDQIDLFGPSGLENIFARSSGHGNEDPKPKKRMGWLQKSDTPIPSSPPPWSTDLASDKNRTLELNVSLDEISEEAAREGSDAEADGSFRSGPFDLEDSRYNLSMGGMETQPLRSRIDPEHASIKLRRDDRLHNRAASGQTELEQEDFSPVYISKHKTPSGQVGYTPLDSRLVKQFPSMNVSLRHPSAQSRKNPSVSTKPVIVADDSDFTDGPESALVTPAPDLSFSENLPTGSPMPDLGRHVEMKRGGYSQYGSFRQRPLSPSPLAHEESMERDETHVSTLNFSESQGQTAESLARGNTGTTQQPRETPTRSPGSPLKLFGPHDTYTSTRLLRRMSQINPADTICEHPTPTSDSRRRKSTQASSGSSFGNGALNDHVFNAEITITSASNSDGHGSDKSPTSEVAPPGSKIPISFRFAAVPDIRDPLKSPQAASKQTTSESKTRSPAEMQPTIEDVQDSELDLGADTGKHRSRADGKRPLASPSRDPTQRKRCRTLPAAELEVARLSASPGYATQLQGTVSSCKGQYASQDAHSNIAQSDLLAQHKILRPRNPTPNQRRRWQIQAEVRDAAEDFAEQEPARLEAVMEQIDSSMASETAPTLQEQAQTLASEVAAFTLKVRKPDADFGERKRSVTTQDFLNEAMMVMKLIRAKARPQSHLGSVEEFDGETLRQCLRADGTVPDDSSLRVSRPPSREAGSGWRSRGPMQTDARVVSHLRRFQEGEERDDTDFIAASIASLQVDDDEHVNDQVVVVDPHANIRITGPPSECRNAQEPDSRPSSQRSRGSTLDTHGSGGTSTGRTIGTNSTRKSDNVGTLAPDAVAHLIGEQVGGMTFDKDKQHWVRVSRSPDKTQSSFLEIPSNVTSDDDPFREISDLPVDELKEQKRIGSPEKVVQESAIVVGRSPIDDQAIEVVTAHHDVQSRTSSQDTVLPRPTTREGPQARHNHSSSVTVPSRYNGFASSQREDVETRATSWGDEELARLTIVAKARQQPLAYAAAKAAIVQRSTADLAAQASAEAKQRSGQGHQLSMIASPAIYGESLQQVSGEEDTVELDSIRDDIALDDADSDVESIAPLHMRKTPHKSAYGPNLANQAKNRQVSLRRQTLANKFTTETHEQSELSVIAQLPGDRTMSVSLSVSRKRTDTWHQSAHLKELTELQGSPSKGACTLLLSDLPEFTVHDIDTERPSERALAARLAQHAIAEVNDRYALAVKELVRTLTDAYEDEPYWEDLKQLDLRDRSLASLYGLDDFCTHVESMDVSNNALSRLDGAPWTLRALNARANQLTSLSSWSHLINLQYLDISHNNLEDLDGLSSLVHLRELRADDNVISRINGISNVTGLLKLRLRRNKLSYVDFSDSRLTHLEELDLCSNRLTSVAGLHELRSLRSLRLDGNSLTEGLQIDQVMPHTITVSAENCELRHLDVSCWPDLGILKVDGNQLCNIENISQLVNLKELSMRRQTFPEDGELLILDHDLDVHTLRLSDNEISSLRLSHSFFSIQHLDMAGVGLHELPADFGLRMPNLRTLNLNFNNLRDVRPLLNIPKLQRLDICGNRLSRLRKSIATFARMTSLQSLDMRDNALTQGFYASLASSLPKITTLVPKSVDRDLRDEDHEAAAVEKARYELPPAEREANRQHRRRLDESTELRRRVYEILLASKCRALRTVDGLEFDRDKVLARDEIWCRLIELGVLRRSSGDGGRVVDELGD